jgi:hypothetical protein
MIEIPNELTALIDKVESGERISTEDCERALHLQALTIANVGRQFVEDAIKREDQEHDRLSSILN